MKQIWVCGGCKSVNQLRASRCYKCHVPRPAAGQELAAVDVPASHEDIVQRAATPGSRYTTWPFALVAIALVVVCVALRLANVIGALGMVEVLVIGLAPPTPEIERVAWLGIAWLVVGLVGALAWGIWIGRVVANLPRLGRGWPNVTPGTAVFECAIPVVNLFRAPAVMREVTARLSSDGLPPNALIFAWWAMLFITLILERPISTVVTLFSSSVEEAIRRGVVMTLISATLFSIAGALAVVLVLLVERTQAIRARELARPSDEVEHAPA
ncbi:MAG TPA: DUF4328 domain-containing protein [Candidatus Limnocylindrales bacterium]